jgi:uncharacterized membrane protein
MNGISHQSDSTIGNKEVEKLSKTEQSGNSKDLFTIYHQNIENFIDGVKQTVPKYYQSITNIQQECLNAYGNIISNTVTSQKEYARKLRIASNVPDAALKIIRDAQKNLLKQQQYKTKFH